MRAWQIAGLAVVLASNVWAGRVIPLVNIQQGDRPNDSKALVELSEEHPGINGTSLKVTFSAEGTLGEWEPKIKNWSNVQALTFEVFNPSEIPVTAVQTVVPKDLKGKTRYNARSDNKLTFKPGQTKVTVSPQEMVNNGGDIFELSEVVSWYIASTAPADAALFFQRIDVQVGE